MDNENVIEEAFWITREAKLVPRKFGAYWNVMPLIDPIVFRQAAPISGGQRQAGIRALRII